MKILMVNNFFSPMGGAEYSILGQIRLLRGAGHDVTCFATDKQPYLEYALPLADLFPPYRDMRAQGLFGKVKGAITAMYNAEAADAIVRAVERFQPDVIHCHNVHYNLTPAVFSGLKRFPQLPVVMNLRDSRMVCFSGLLSTVDDPEPRYCTTGNPMTCLESRCKNGSLTETLYCLMDAELQKRWKLFERVDQFIVPSRGMYDLMRACRVPAERLTQVNNFLTQDCFERDPVTTTDGSFVYVGRLSPEKGVHYLIEAFKDLPQYHLHVLGVGPEEQALKDQAAGYGMTNVTFWGFQSGETLEGLYKNCMATILPCTWFEALPRSILETFSFGKPAIATAVGANPELVDDGVTGYLVPPHDAAALRDAVLRLASDPERAIAMGRAGYDKVHASYTPQVHLRGLMGVYETQLAKRHGKSVAMAGL